MSKQTRRGLLKNAAAAAIAATGAATALAPEAEAQAAPAQTPAQTPTQTGIVWEKKAIHRASETGQGTLSASGAAAVASENAPTPTPLFNGIITFGNLVFIAGIGAHFKGTIEEHTKHVLDEMEKNLILAGSSMNKVLKVNVYLSDLANYTRMNTAYTGRFGSVPPVRTTVAVAGGVPGDSLVEIDCIASL